tara:strand:+ start:508 stop:1791 length:1284 start_codon:yes stop_codon:yes gene_type:complete
MIIAFDFPKNTIGDEFDHWPEEFNGLINIQDGIEPYFGSAPPSFVDLLHKFEKDFKILSSDKAITSIKPFYYFLETQGPPEGWLGMIDGHENTLLSGVSEKILESVREGQCTIVLWSCNEGYDPFQYEIFDRIYEELQSKYLPFDNFIFVSGNLIIDVLHQAWAKVNNQNYLIKCLPFNNEIYDDYSKIQDNVIYDKDSKERDKYFLLLNRAPRIHRMAFISWLNSENLLENTLTSYPSEKLAPYNFSKKSDLSVYFSRMLCLDRKTKSKCLSGWKDLEENKLPLIVDVDEWGTNHYGTSVDWLYSKTFFSVVTESIYDDLSVFLDEKIWKPIYNYHPFLMIGCPNSLVKLREFGFKTFSPWIDESYDLELNHGKRMGMVVNEIKKLCSMSIDELRGWYQNLIPILEHNKSFLESDSSQFDKLLKRI